MFFMEKLHFRNLRDLQKLVDEMMAMEPHWRNMSVASRNRELIRRWKQQVKKLTRFVFIVNALTQYVMKRLTNFRNFSDPNIVQSQFF